MPAPLNAAANLIFGAAGAMLLRRDAALRDDPFNGYFFTLLLFEAALVTPAATYLFRFYPDWSLLYWFDPQIYPRLELYVGWLSGTAIVANFILLLLGYTAARWGILRESRALMAAPVATGAVAMAVFGLQYWRRIAFVGSYEAFWQGGAELVFGQAPGIVGMGTYLAAGLLLWGMRARSRRAQQQKLAHA